MIWFLYAYPKKYMVSVSIIQGRAQNSTVHDKPECQHTDSEYLSSTYLTKRDFSCNDKLKNTLSYFSKKLEKISNCL